MNEFALSLVFGFIVSGIIVGLIFALEEGWRGILRYFLSLIVFVGGFVFMTQFLSFAARIVACEHIKYALAHGTPVRPEILQSRHARQCGVDITPLLGRVEGRDPEAGVVPKPEASSPSPDRS